MESVEDGLGKQSVPGAFAEGLWRKVTMKDSVSRGSGGLCLWVTVPAGGI